MKDLITVVAVAVRAYTALRVGIHPSSLPLWHESQESTRLKWLASAGQVVGRVEQELCQLAAYRQKKGRKTAGHPTVLSCRKGEGREVRRAVHG